MASFTETITGVDVGVTLASTADLVAEQAKYMRDRLVLAVYERRDRQGFIDQFTMDNLKAYNAPINKEVEAFSKVITSKTVAGETMLRKRHGDRRAVPSKEDRLKTAGYFGSRTLSRFLSATEARDHQALQDQIISFIFDKYDKKKKYQAASHVPETDSMYTPPSHVGELALLPLVQSCSEATDKIVSSFDVYGCGKEEGESAGVPATMTAIEEHLVAYSLAKLVELGYLNPIKPMIMKITLGRYKLILGRHTKLESLDAYGIEQSVARTTLEDAAKNPKGVAVEVNYLGGFTNAINARRTIIVGQFTVSMTNNRGVNVPVRIVAKFVSHDERPLTALVVSSSVVDNHGNEFDAHLMAGADPFVITVKGSVSSSELHATGERMPLSEDEYLKLRAGRMPDDTRGAPFVKYEDTGSVVADEECRIASRFDPYTGISWRMTEEVFKSGKLELGSRLLPHVYGDNLDLAARHRLKSTSCRRSNIDLEDIPLTQIEAGLSQSLDSLSYSRRRAFSTFIHLTLHHVNSPLLDENGFTPEPVTKMLLAELLNISDQLFLDGEREVFSVGPRSAMRRIVSGSVLRGTVPNLNSNTRTFTTEDCLYCLIISLVTRQDTTVNSRAFPLISMSQTVSRYLNTPLCTLYRNPQEPTSDKSVIALYKASANIVDNLFDRIDLSNLLNTYSTAYDFIIRAMSADHKALAGFPSIKKPFATVNTGFSYQNSDIGRVTVSIGNMALSCDCLIADCLRAIIHKIDKSVPERVFVFYHDKIAILFCLPNRILDAGNTAKVFINFSPRPSRMTRLIKSSTNIADEGIMLNTALFGRGGVAVDGYFESLPSEITV